MFDFHLHSHVSFDSQSTPGEMTAKAVALGLQEICFTDHYDCHSDPEKKGYLFDLNTYSAAYDTLTVPGLTIRHGVEFGLTSWNKPLFDTLLQQRDFDFVIGSAHFVAGYDPYDAEFWEGLTVEQAFSKYLTGVLDYVRIHDNYDVLGHLTYVCKSVNNPSHAPVPFSAYQEITDEIMKILVHKGIGMEINTSGMDRAGAFLPSAEYLRRFKELGGEIVTVGSDAHDPTRLGQYIPEALDILKDIFGYVCTFQQRKPVFHKL